MASKRFETYVCAVCGNVVEVIHAGGGTLVCCSVPMEISAENSTDAAQEKHVPVIEKVDGGYRVIVGSTPHPMLPEHFIDWIELIADGRVYRQYLNPGDAPEAVFQVEAQQITARDACNLHGVWRSAA